MERAERLIRWLMNIPLFRASAMFTISGAAFAIGNLLLARALPVVEFGNFALALALFNMSAQLAPMGLDQLMLRHELALDRRMLFRLLLCSGGVGAAIGALAYLSGGLDAGSSGALALALCPAGLIWAGSYGLRTQATERQSMLLATSTSWIIGAIGVAAQFHLFHEALAYILMFALAVSIVGAAGWAGLRALRTSKPTALRTIPWREALTLLGLTAIGAIGIQLERLIVPLTLSVRDLATFSVLASVAIFPFKLVTSGAGFSLVPRLRAAANAAERRATVRKEIAAVVGFLSVASAGCILLAPSVTDLITGGRYQIGFWLVCAACLNGSAKVFQALPRAIITACGSGRDLALLNRLGWLGLLAAGLAAIAGSWAGLEGLVAGAALGSLAGSIPGSLIARRALRQRGGDSAGRFAVDSAVDGSRFENSTKPL